MEMVRKQVKLEQEWEKSEGPTELGQISISAAQSPHELRVFSPLNAGQQTVLPGEK